MIEFLKKTWDYLYGSFHGSETIIWARFNMLIGSVWVAAQSTDLSPVFNNPKYLALWIVFSNFVNEMARRRRATFDDTGSLK